MVNLESEGIVEPVLVACILASEVALQVYMRFQAMALLLKTSEGVCC
jgi:hypothetical protein